NYYALVNYKYRRSLDMNRPIARNELFRQFIPYYLTQLRKTYKKIPLLYDIHSFSKDYEWIRGEKYDVVVFLFSFSKRLLIDLFLEFWTQRGYTTTLVYGAENCDAPQCFGTRRVRRKECRCNDIVVAHKDRAYSFLFEFQESIIKKKQFLEDAVDFFQLLENEVEKRRVIEVQD
ncbi:unnamed protein product, partial [marine sediment metagenome]